MRIYHPGLDQFAKYMQEHKGWKIEGRVSIITADEADPEALRAGIDNFEKTMADVRARNNLSEDAVLSPHHFDAYTDTATGLRFEFNNPSRALSAGEISTLQERYNANPTSQEMWSILAELTCTGVLDGAAVFYEYQYAKKFEQWSFENIDLATVDFDENKLLERLYRIVDQFNGDLALDLHDREKGAKAYEDFADMVQRIIS